MSRQVDRIGHKALNCADWTKRNALVKELYSESYGLILREDRLRALAWLWLLWQREPEKIVAHTIEGKLADMVDTARLYHDDLPNTVLALLTGAVEKRALVLARKYL
jgi:hypothetical protein